MSIRFKLYFFLTLLLLSWQACAGKDPIAWRLIGPFENPVFSGRSYTATYTFTNQLPLRLARPLVIYKNTATPAEFNFIDNCTGRLLNPFESCTVRVTLVPGANGTKTVQLTIAGYNNSQVPLPILSTVSQGAPSGEVRGLVVFGLPNQLEEGSSANYTFAFFNRGTSIATNLSALITQTEGNPNIVTNTCTGSLNPNAFCSISGSYTPNSSVPPLQQVRATLTFDGASGSPAIANTSTTVVGAVTGDIVASIVPPYYLPAVMPQNTAYPLEFLFTNVSSAAVPLRSFGITCVDNLANSCNSLITSITSSCGIPSLNPTAACTINGTFTAPAATNPTTFYTVTGFLDYVGTGNPAGISTQGAVITSLSTTRTFTLVNNCDFPVWFSLNGAAVSGFNCTTGCPVGTACNLGNNGCFWENYGPDVGTSFQLAPSGGNNTVTIPTPGFASNGIQWSGNITASTGCNGSTTCLQADCDNNGGSTACAPGQGFTQPATQAEITMNLTTDDSYDVEVINGFHIPVSMRPMDFNNVPSQANNYICGTPGNFAATNGFGACNWLNAAPPVPNGGYNWVTSGGSACNITSSAPGQCSSGELCGLDINFNQVCGDFLGYWSANQVCNSASVPTTVSNYFLCTQSLPSPYFPSNAVLSTLMACPVPSGDTSPTYNSCYLDYPSTTYSLNEIQTCCGCVDWWDPTETGGATIGSNPNTQSCTPPASAAQTDPQWNQYIQPMIQWMKAACPSAYTYPFDDKTSGFSCTNNLPGQPNSVGYLITFCQGNTGLPSGITDGR